MTDLEQTFEWSSVLRQTMQMSSSLRWSSEGPKAMGASLKMAFPAGISRRATKCLKRNEIAFESVVFVGRRKIS